MGKDRAGGWPPEVWSPEVQIARVWGQPCSKIWCFSLYTWRVSGVMSPLGCVSGVLVLLLPMILAVDIESQTFVIWKVFSLLHQMTLTNFESPWLWESCFCYGFWKSIQISSWIFFHGLCAYLLPTQGREYGEQSLCLSGGQEVVTPRFDSEDLICCKYYYCILFM